MSERRRKQPRGSRERRRPKSLLRALLHPIPALNLLRRSIQKVKRPNDASKLSTYSVSAVGGGSPKPATAKMLSPPSKFASIQLSSSTNDSYEDTDRKSAASGPRSPGVISEIDDAKLERRVALLQKRLLWVVNENESANKRDTHLLQRNKDILMRIDMLKKRLEEAGDDFRRDAQNCGEKIEREEMRQNQLLMDLKERVDKVSDICNDMSAQMEEISKTLSAYTFTDGSVIYLFVSSLRNFIVDFIRFLFRFVMMTIKPLEPASQDLSSRSIPSKRGSPSLRRKAIRLSRPQ
uniref:Uncharacterized protein n=1 Tax=Parascaris univalens TaxID=6257 RepID=A0A915C3M4_PARUN